MKIGDRVYVHGYVDEIRKDIVIIRNDGGYFGTIKSEIVEAQNAEDIVSVIRCKGCKHYMKDSELCHDENGSYYNTCPYMGEALETDYCSKAERKEE